MLAKLKANQERIRSNIANKPTQTKLARELDVKSVSVVNIVHLMILKIDARDGCEVNTTFFMRHLLCLLSDNTHVEMPFLGNEIVIGNFCINVALIKNNSNFVRVSIQGQDTMLMVSYLIFMLSWIISNIKERQYYVSAAYHQYVSCVCSVIMHPCSVILDTSNAPKYDTNKYEIIHLKKSFPGAYVRIHDPSMGFKMVTVFARGKMNVLGVTLHSAIWRLFEFINFIRPFCQNDTELDSRKRKEIHSMLYERQQLKKMKTSNNSNNNAFMSVIGSSSSSKRNKKQ